jgi:hypothetical protein
MSERRRDRITVVPTTPTIPPPPGLEDAPSDGQRYVRISGQWSIMPQLVTSWESGTAYYDGAVSLYVVYGADGNWQATRATSTQTLSTAAGQSGTKPSTLATLRSLSYS